MKMPNPLPPAQMTPTERRAELFRLLALGLVRLHQRHKQRSDPDGESSLHFPAEQSGSPDATDRRAA